MGWDGREEVGKRLSRKAAHHDSTVDFLGHVAPASASSASSATGRSHKGARGAWPGTGLVRYGQGCGTARDCAVLRGNERYWQYQATGRSCARPPSASGLARSNAATATGGDWRVWPSTPHCLGPLELSLSLSLSLS